MPAAPSTRDALMHAAEHLVRTRGYSAFSYADLAEVVGIRKASIHHHFPAKADLGAALVEQYIARFRTLLAEIERDEATAMAKLKRYVAIYEHSVAQGMLCLCGMLSSEMQVLPTTVQAGVKTYFNDQLRWLGKVMDAGQRGGELQLPGTAKNTATRLLATVQGASLVAWGTGDVHTMSRVSGDFLLSIRT